MGKGLTLEQAQAAGFAPEPSGGMSLEQAQASGFQPADPFAAKPREPAPPAQPEPSRLDKFLNFMGLKGGDIVPEATPFKPGSPEHAAAVQNAMHPDKLRQDAGPLADDWIAQGIVGGLAGAGAGRYIQAGAQALKVPALAARIAGSAAEGATASKVQGGDASTGALIGAAVPAAGALVRGGARKATAALRNPKTEIGRTLNTLDEAKASGVMKTPEFQALPRGAEGFNQAATTAEEKLASTNSEILRNARERYGRRLEMVMAPNADRHHLVTETDKLIGDLGAENTINGEVIDEHLASALGKVRRMLTTDTGEIDAAGARANVEAIANGEMDAPTVTAPAVKVGDLIKVKRAVAKLADYGSPATPETRPYRLLDKSLGRDLEGIDPRIGEINREYAGTMGQLEEANDILYGSQRADVVRNTAKEKRARGLLGRVGDTTQAATLAAKDIERLKGLDPRYRDILAPVEAKKASERAAFGLPHVSRRIEHMPFAALQQNATALGVHVVDPFARALAGAAPSSVDVVPFLSAREAERNREANRAAAARGGR